MADKKSYYVTVNDEGKVGSASDIRLSEDAEVVLQIPDQQAKNFSGDGITQWDAIAELTKYIKSGATVEERAQRAHDARFMTGKRPFGMGDLLVKHVVLVDLDEDEVKELKSGNRSIDLSSVPEPKDEWSKLRKDKAKLKKDQ